MGKILYIVALSALIVAVVFRSDLAHLYYKLLSLASAPSKAAAERIFTKDELKQYKGEKGLCLAILGKVYDVSKGEKFYGKDGGYHFFTGLDGTRAFVSGDFTEAGLIEDITGLTHTDVLGLEDWQKRYEKDYVYVGKLVGMYYDANGRPTEALHNWRRMLGAARKAKAADDLDFQNFPACNSQFSDSSGTVVWCSDMSGGTKRSWTGVPRKYYKPPGTTFRCACVRDKGSPGNTQTGAGHPDRGDLDNPYLREYEGCDPTSVTCKVL